MLNFAFGCPLLLKVSQSGPSWWHEKKNLTKLYLVITNNLKTWKKSVTIGSFERIGPGGGALTWKGGMGMSGSQDPIFMPLPPFFRSPVAAWFSSLDPHFEQKYQILTPAREICQKFAEFTSSAA